MAASMHFFVPGRLDRLTGGSIYDRRMVEELRRASVPVTVHELVGRFPMVDGPARDAAASALADVPPDAALVVDGLALPALVDGPLDRDSRSGPLGNSSQAITAGTNGV